jgi:hypothetical protein
VQIFLRFQGKKAWGQKETFGKFKGLRFDPGATIFFINATGT